MLNPAIVQAMTAEAFCEMVIRTQREAQEQRQRADGLQKRVGELEAELAELREPNPENAYGGD